MSATLSIRSDRQPTQLTVVRNRTGNLFGAAVPFASVTDDPLDRSTQYEAAYRGGRDAILSIFSGALWAILGVFGVGLLWMTAIALNNGTASLSTFAAALFGVIIAVVTVDELFHRLFDHTPIL